MAAALAILAGIGHHRFPERYFLALQEDRFAEWLTFWSFATAAIIFGLASLRCGRHRSRAVWFLVAMTPTARRMAVAASLVVALGVSSAAASSHLVPVDPMKVEAARLETDALRADLREIAQAEGDLAAGKCGLHKRLYSFVEKYGKSELREGSFANLVRGLSSLERARFFIDPWNTPYWIRLTCDRDGADGVVLIYSLGPNRMRDSTRDEIRGDDVGALLTRARLAAVPQLTR